MTEEIAKFYFGEVLLAIEYLHSKGILFWDLKPENILIDEEGHIAITDFGLSETGFTSESWSTVFCGSPEYLSPEIIKEEGHGFMCDIYSLGALLYEFLTGLPPFYSKDKKWLFEWILHNELVFPEYLSENATDLLRKMLEKDQTKRIGFINGISEIKSHPFCSDINFEDLEKKKVKPTFTPALNEIYFDEEYLNQQVQAN